MKKILFLVPSVIHFANQPLSYSTVRSVFSPDERAEQTIRTVESIRSKVPNATVVLIEMGLEHAPKELQAMVDRYLYVGNRKIVRSAVDGLHKGYGEVVGLLLANHVVRPLNPDYCFKLSGRYYLDEHFDITRWNTDTFTFKEGPGWVSTRLYGFPFGSYESFRRALKQAIPFQLQGEAIENTIWRLIPHKHHLDPLGVSGTVAPWNQAVSD